MTHRILVVSAHPDDETYGAGGTLARHADLGHEVHVLFMSDGVGARHDHAEQQCQAAVNACDALGVTQTHFAGLPDQRLDGMALIDVIDPIYKLVKELRPSTVYTHHKGDVNQDHRTVFEASLVAVRPFGDNPVEQVLCFEVPSATDWGPTAMEDWAFLPSVFVDITRHRANKAKAIDAYRNTHDNEVKPFPHPRSQEAVDALDTARGVSVGMESAEAFMLVRSLIR